MLIISGDDGVEDGPSPSHIDDHEILLKSHTGMFIGILLLAGVITSIVLFYFATGEGDYVKSGLIYWITDIVLQGFVSLTQCTCTSKVVSRPNNQCFFCCSSFPTMATAIAATLSIRPDYICVLDK